MWTDIYPIRGPWIGTLSIAPRPRGGEWLADELRCWSQAGVNLVASLLTPPENVELELDAERDLCQAAGISFHSLPIPDRGLPASQRTFDALLDDLEIGLRSGRSEVVHCRQGIGRVCLVAASLLIRAGYDAESAIECVATARRRPVPDTDEQREWLRFRAIGQGAHTWK